jgi:SAM-dependent methyltransferase
MRKPPDLGEGRVGTLADRYSFDDMRVFTPQERRGLHIAADADPRRDPSIAWELLYRLEPELYERLVNAEPLHRGILDWLPARVDRIVEVGSGSGRLTLELVDRCDHLIAIEPAAPLREILMRKLRARQAPATKEVRVIAGFFDALPVADRSAELVVACSALTPEAGRGGDRGLREMERVCAPGGAVVVVWPSGREWLEQRGYRYLAFPGEMTMEFDSPEEAIELARIFYPSAVEQVKRRGDRCVPYDLLGVNAPRDLAYKTMA